VTEEWQAKLGQALERASRPGGPVAGWAEVMRRGTLRVGLYSPPGTDPQGPHTQDEVYVVMRGVGTFVRGGERVAFEAGDVLFVAAGVAHRFEEFSEDFTAWVVFYGPEGGE
jgi:mannose-6-phosphate isomerase-like protein (cupin superfamily)